MTGGRIKRAQELLRDEPFLLTYGDGVCDVDIDKLLAFHRGNGKIATITMVSIAQQKGVLTRNERGEIQSFREKEEGDAVLINGGYMVLNPEIFSYIEGDGTVFEKEPMHLLAEEGQLMGYEHKGFWQCLDTRCRPIQIRAFTVFCVETTGSVPSSATSEITTVSVPVSKTRRRSLFFIWRHSRSSGNPIAIRVRHMKQT